MQAGDASFGSEEEGVKIEERTLKLRPKTMTLSACTANVADSAL
jgi:hypothetical protein